MDKKEFLIKASSVAIGLIVGVVVLFGIWTIHQDHKALAEVVTFLNQQIKASQQAQPVK